jgi:hypothetical protein
MVLLARMPAWLGVTRWVAMRDADGWGQQELRKVEDWLFAILRFAITRDETDRATIMAAAARMDRPDAPLSQSDFSFFTRTSREICNAIAGRERAAKLPILDRCLREVGNDRLRRALAAALKIERPATATGKLGRRYGDDLWRGLPIRH